MGIEMSSRKPLNQLKKLYNLRNPKGIADGFLKAGENIAVGKEKTLL
jgi:hypothetical protein